MAGLAQHPEARKARLRLPPPPPAVPAGSGTSLYVHVPFCVVKCGYCDFNSYVVEGTDAHDAFLTALDRELQHAAVPERPVAVFIGGGTPTQLDPGRLQRLFATLSRFVDLAACPEVTMEANPESTTVEKAAIALASGVRRISLGVQSFDPERLRFLDRAHSADQAVAAVGAVRRAGFENVSLDLIFGLPGQSLPEWQRDLEQALALRPAHLSCYNLAFEPGTRLMRDLELGRVTRNDENLDRLLFAWTRERLSAAGFAAYEVSNFAGPGGPCLHNDHYWLQGDYVGVGPGASSHRRGWRGTSLKTLDAWAEAVMAGLPATATAETLTPGQRAGEAVWLGLRRRDGVDLAALEARIGWPVRERFASIVAEQEAKGWLRRELDRIRLVGEGLLFADVVGVAFLLPVAPDRHPSRAARC